MINGLQKVPYKRKLVSKQLYTGHLRIDLNQPMVMNNCILLKGPANSGKTMVIRDTITEFLNNDNEGKRRVVYVTPNYANSKVRNNLIEEHKQKCTVVTTNNDASVNGTDLYLMPRTALVVAQKLRQHDCDVLLVFDRVMDYDINEKRIFQNAKQPFSPTNIFNEIMENSGDFGPGNGTITSVLALDTDTVNFNYDQAQLKLLVHLESVVDQIVSFEPELKAMRSYVPKLDLYEFCSANVDYWQHPLVAATRADVEQFTRDLRSAFKQNHARRELGMQEDPWENYLYHDSKFILPLITHKTALPISHQILLFKFLQRSVDEFSDPNQGWNDSISQFSKSPEQVKNMLFEYANEYDEFDGDKTILDIIEDFLSEPFENGSIESYKQGQMEVYEINSLIDRFLKLFYSNCKLNGHLRDTKDDYFK